MRSAKEIVAGLSASRVRKHSKSDETILDALPRAVQVGLQSPLGSGRTTGSCSPMLTTANPLTFKLPKKGTLVFHKRPWRNMKTAVITRRGLYPIIPV